MARTPENGEREAHPTCSTKNVDAPCSERGKPVDPLAIKQELLIDLDQSSDVSINAGEKEWPFAPTDSTAGLFNSNELVRGTVLFGSNITDSANKQKIQRILEQSSR